MKVRKKKKTVAARAREKPSDAKTSGVKPLQQNDEHEKEWNFEGLPDRDLKRNLGCG